MVSGELSLGQHVVLARDWFRVTMSDTDAARVIYFGAPAQWAERLLCNWLADAGAPLSKSLDAGFGDPVVHVEMTYRGPLRLDDQVTATLSLARRTKSSMTFHFAFALDADSSPAVEVWLTKVHVHFGPGGLEAVPIAGPLLTALDAAAG
jgi:acyl-CoA thioesterase FadM